MNNEEKILDILNTLAGDMHTVKASIVKLDSGQAETNTGLAAVAKDVKAVCEQTADLVEFEAEMRLKITPLIAVTKDNMFDIAVLKHKAV